MKILIVVAHPNDEVLACAGTVSKLIAQGAEAYTLLLGEGASLKHEDDDLDKKEERLKSLQKNIFEASKVVGVKRVFEYNFPSNQFDTVPLFEMVKVIEKVKNDIRPELVLTHYEKDLNIDHRITYQAVTMAMKPLPGDPVKAIYSFELPSSTEWAYPLSFSPNLFFDISETLETKLAACGKYQSQMRDFPHPKSLEGIEMNAKMWGMKVGVKYAEAFCLIRGLR